MVVTVGQLVWDLIISRAMVTVELILKSKLCGLRFVLERFSA
jgi:hypothetical protein